MYYRAVTKTSSSGCEIGLAGAEDELARVYEVEVDVDDHHGHWSLGDQYCAAISGAGCPGTAIGTLTPGDIKPEIKITNALDNGHHRSIPDSRTSGTSDDSAL